MKELRIGLEDIDPLYERLSINFQLNMPDYAVFKIVIKSLTRYVNFTSYEYIGGNIPVGHPKLRWHSAKADGEYLGKFDVIQLYTDDQGQVSALTAIHEILHYRNKHKGIDMTEGEVHKEAKEICKELGLCI